MKKDMKIKIRRLCAFMLVLLSLIGFGARAAAQVHNVAIPPDAEAETVLYRHAPIRNFQIRPEGGGTSANWSGYAFPPVPDSPL